MDLQMPPPPSTVAAVQEYATHTPPKQDEPQPPTMKSRGPSEVNGDSALSPLLELPPTSNQKENYREGVEDRNGVRDTFSLDTNPVTIWQECGMQALRVLEDSVTGWTEEWRRLHQQEQAALQALDSLHAQAQEMNLSFHRQMDGLHATVVDLVSSFKK